MEELRVPKRRVLVEVLLPDGARRRMALFLAGAAATHAGPETPADLLNGAEEFVPALDEDAGSMAFLNRRQVSAVRIPGAAAAGEADALTLPTEHEVEIELAGGATLRGLVSYVRPPARSRLVDFLNEPEPFFALLEPDATALVNKHQVARVALLSRT
jgi:hypothetical protein